MRINDGISDIQNKPASFLMAGQSNMAGRGDFGEVPEIRNPLCYMLRMGRWQPMSEPINPDRAIWGIRFHSGVSLAASFAEGYAKHFNSPVGLIPCADGGTTISEWMKGELLFDHAMMQCSLASRTSEIKGILWHQGESDCKTAESLNSYADKLIAIISAMRNELQNPTLPVIIGEISEDISDNWKMEKRNVEFNKLLPEIVSHIPNSIIVSSKGLNLKADGIHFTSEACREFGKRYFEAYLSIK